MTPTPLPQAVSLARAETPYAYAIAVIAELNAQPCCRICERKFTMTPERLDLCARCSEI